MNSQSQQSRHFARKYSTAHLVLALLPKKKREHGRNITKSVRKKDFRTCKRLNWFAIEFDMRKAEIYLFTLSFQLLLFRHASFLRPLPTKTNNNSTSSPPPRAIVCAVCDRIAKYAKYIASHLLQYLTPLFSLHWFLGFIKKILLGIDKKSSSLPAARHTFHSIKESSASSSSPSPPATLHNNRMKNVLTRNKFVSIFHAERMFEKLQRSVYRIFKNWRVVSGTLVVRWDDRRSSRPSLWITWNLSFNFASHSSSSTDGEARNSFHMNGQQPYWAKDGMEILGVPSQLNWWMGELLDFVECFRTFFQSCKLFPAEIASNVRWYDMRMVVSLVWVKLGSRTSKYLELSTSV